eukprot:Rhum_TRINITY_DN4407_c0_g1::Rhum_TRINITY_DN4407_c0_g1_i1::g.14262::m.14262
MAEQRTSLQADQQQQQAPTQQLPAPPPAVQQAELSASMSLFAPEVGVSRPSPSPPSQPQHTPRGSSAQYFPPPPQPQPLAASTAATSPSPDPPPHPPQASRASAHGFAGASRRDTSARLRKTSSARQRRTDKEEREYTAIYQYMQQQVLYAKRKVVKRDAATETTLSLPPDPFDERALADVCAYLCEEYRRMGAAVGEPPDASELVACARNDQVRPTVGDIRWTDEPPSLDASATHGERMGARDRKELEDKLLRAKADHAGSLKALEAMLTKAHQAKLEEVKAEASVAAKKAEAAAKVREEVLTAEKMRVAALSEYEQKEKGRHVEALQKEIAELRGETKELRAVIEAKDALMSNMVHDHAEFHINEKERSVELAGRVSAAVTSMTQVLQKKQYDLDTANAVDHMSRLSSTYAKREAILRRSSDEAYSKLTALERDYRNLLFVHTQTTQLAAEKLSDKIVIRVSGGPRKVRAKPPPQPTVTLVPEQTCLTGALTCRPCRRPPEATPAAAAPTTLPPEAERGPPKPAPCVRVPH